MARAKESARSRCDHAALMGADRRKSAVLSSLYVLQVDRPELRVTDLDHSSPLP